MFLFGAGLRGVAIGPWVVKSLVYGDFTLSEVAKHTVVNGKH